MNSVDSELVNKWRSDFPILQRNVKGKALVYLDNAATSQKPSVVIDSLTDYYNNYNANVHRGIHSLSEEATFRMESARAKVANFISASESRNLIFTKGTTEGINLIASVLGEFYFKDGDEIILSEMEHHANIVPWQLLQKRVKVKIKVIPVLPSGCLDMDTFQSLIAPNTKLISITHTSNALGTINPIDEISKVAETNAIPLLIDAAQGIAHEKIDVKQLNCDFLVFSAHKVLGPTGIGCLYINDKWIDVLPPYQGGGEMIDKVSFELTTYNEAPFRFEAGTPHIEGIIGLGAAIDYLDSPEATLKYRHEKNLLALATTLMNEMEGIRIIGEAPDKSSILSFIHPKAHHQDIALMLDAHGIAVRSGHHCTQPLMKAFGIDGTTRASFAFYNTEEEVHFFIETLKKVLKQLS